MSLLAWERPSVTARRLLNGKRAAQQAPSDAMSASPSLPAVLSPLRMTIVGALLIATGPISMSLYSPAMTLLVTALHTTTEAVRATITVYLFGFASAQLICGPLSDRFGRRPILIGCLMLYVIGSGVSAAAGSVSALIVGRLIQGLSLIHI